MIRRLIVPLAAAIVTLHAGQVFAQSGFPAPLPGQTGAANNSPFPPVNGAAPAPSFGGAPSLSSFPASRWLAVRKHPPSGAPDPGGSK